MTNSFLWSSSTSFLYEFRWATSREWTSSLTWARLCGFSGHRFEPSRLRHLVHSVTVERSTQRPNLQCFAMQKNVKGTNRRFYPGMYSILIRRSPDCPRLRLRYSWYLLYHSDNKEWRSIVTLTHSVECLLMPYIGIFQDGFVRCFEIVHFNSAVFTSNDHIRHAVSEYVVKIDITDAGQMFRICHFPFRIRCNTISAFKWSRSKEQAPDVSPADFHLTEATVRCSIDNLTLSWTYDINNHVLMGFCSALHSHFYLLFYSKESK